LDESLHPLLMCGWATANSELKQSEENTIHIDFCQSYTEI